MDQPLGGNEPVKWVVVNRWQLGRAIDGFPDEIHDFNVLQPGLLLNPVARGLGQRQLADAVFQRNFPDRRQAYMPLMPFLSKLAGGFRAQLTRRAGQPNERAGV